MRCLATGRPGASSCLHKFDDYYYGYTTQDGKDKPGYVDMIN